MWAGSNSFQGRRPIELHEAVEFITRVRVATGVAGGGQDVRGILRHPIAQDLEMQAQAGESGTRQRTMQPCVTMTCIVKLLPMAAPTPPTLSIRKALDHSEPLARLSQRVQESRQRLDAIAPLLPMSLRALVRPGPIDAETWTLLAANGAVAAKLRQVVPALQARLGDAGWPPLAVRIRVLAAE